MNTQHISHDHTPPSFILRNASVAHVVYSINENILLLLTNCQVIPDVEQISFLPQRTAEDCL